MTTGHGQNQSAVTDSVIHRLDYFPGAIFQVCLQPDQVIKFTYISAGCQDLFDLEPEQVQEDTWMLLHRLHPQDRSVLTQTIREAAATRHPWRWQGRCQLASGYRWIEASCHAPSQQGRPGGDRVQWQGLFTDITHHKQVELSLQQSTRDLEITMVTQAAELEQAVLRLQNQISDRHQVETALRESKASLLRLSANVPGMLYQCKLHTDGSLSFPYVSEGCRDIYELEPMQLRQAIDQVVHPDDLAWLKERVYASAQTLERFQEEWRIITASGQIKWVQSFSRPERQPDGSVLWDGVLLDISDRKQADAELQLKTQELERTLQDLQLTQTQVIHTEKMSGLGQLVAGIAHEINNPVNFIYGNLAYADTYINNLLELVAAYQQHYPTPGSAIEQLADDIELEFLIEDLPKLLASMKVGSERIQKIVTSLRSFSRMDESDKKAVDIHDGLESTLLILQSRLKAKAQWPGITIQRDYGSLPLVECYAGQLNQVFLNILGNAIDALEDDFMQQGQGYQRRLAETPSGSSPSLPRITICTQVEGNQAIISIQDDGPGIPESIQTRLFDPFFTTKPIGKGTGLGMSISYQIITEKHGGSLGCHSKPGTGATFVISIPLHQSDS